jgi:hypothetical protein
VDPKMIFSKNQELVLYSAKVQTHPDSSKIGRSLRKIQNIPPTVVAMNRELICVSQVVYLCGVLCLAFDFAFWQRHHKKPDFGTTKMEKALFVRRNKNQPTWRSSPSQGTCAC